MQLPFTVIGDEISEISQLLASMLPTLIMVGITVTVAVAIILLILAAIKS